jgi:hypothetical protein
MKKLIFSIFTIGSFMSFAQQTKGQSTFNWAIYADTFYVTPPLRDITPIEPTYNTKSGQFESKNDMRRQKYTNPNAFPHGNDPVWQRTQGEQYNKAPIQNFNGIVAGLAFPPDPSGAVGPNHYVQMVNSSIQIFDKSGNSLWGPSALNSIITSNGGDPIVMYDRFADRWFISGFGNGNSLSMAVSQTNDPTGAYYVWEYSMSSLPDYPKYSIWHDGYYLTANKSGVDCFVLDRNAMLTGDVNAQMISMSIPNLATGSGTNTGGFHSVLPAHADFVMPPASKKLNLFYYQDDAWTGVTQDEIKIWDVTVDWANTANSTVTEIQTLAVTPFDSQFNSSWNDIEQPGTSQRLDGIPGAFMYRAQYTEWGSHNTVMLNHTVDVDATNHAGIRWYELRETGGVWSVYQQSTFAPDTESRWLGSISMDYQGNIGLAYSVSGPNTMPSLRYTGRYSSDPLNQMTLAEEDIIIGTGVQTGANRYGDYAHLSVDPLDNATFWYTGEYIRTGGSRGTRIASFKLANDFNDDLGVIAVNSPANGNLTSTEIIDVTVKNFGLVDQSNFDVNFQIDGGTVVTETYSGILTAGATATFTFTQTGDFSTTGQTYNIKSFTTLASDQFIQNDTFNTNIQHLFSDDIGVTIINNPNTGQGLGVQTVDVTIDNFGYNTVSNFDVAYTINGGTPVVETFTNNLLAGSSVNYTFTTQADLSYLGLYDIVAYTNLNTDSDHTNDTTYSSVENQNCQPQGNCSFGDGLTNFTLGTISNATGCSSNGGYNDFTTMSTDLFRGQDYALTVTSGYNPQYTYVWIDFNDNFSFEANELIYSGQTNLGLSTTITIDATVNLGEHLLRAKASDNDAEASDPCLDMQYGETEDYKVLIKSNIGLDESQSNNALQIVAVQGNVYTLKINNANAFSGNLKIHNSLGQLVYTSVVNDNNTITVDLSNYAKGTYLLNVYNGSSNSVIKLVNK